MKAAAEHQQRLLEVQGLDARLDQLAHRRRTLPEEEQLAGLDRRLTGLRDMLIGAETERSDIDRQRAKADTDVEQVRARAARDQQRLDSGQVGSPKELENLQHEIASLARRQSELEDVELEILQRLEDIDARVAELRAEIEQVETERAELAVRRDAAVADIERESAQATSARSGLVPQIEPALVTLYDKVRGQQGGIGAAELKHKRCGGCRMEMNSGELAEARSAAPDEVLRHEECGRILIRTPESGL